MLPPERHDIEFIPASRLGSCLWNYGVHGVHANDIDPDSEIGIGQGRWRMSWHWSATIRSSHPPDFLLRFIAVV